MERLPLPLFGALLPSAVPSIRCRSLLATLSSHGFSLTGSGYPAGYRNNDRLVLDDEALAAEFWALPALQTALAQLGPLAALGATWDAVAANPRFRACRYEGGQSFTRHRDGAWLETPERRTFLTAQLYLDDGFVGGATRFYEERHDAAPTVSVIPRRGDLVLFDHRLWHDGEAVVEGRKHVLRTDIVYQRRPAPERLPEPDRYAIPGAPYVFSLVARRDGTLAAGTREGRVIVLARTIDGLVATESASLGPSSVTSLAEDARGRLFAGTRSGAVFAVDEGGPTRVWSADSAITSLAAHPAGLLATTAAGVVARIGTSGAHAVATLPGWAWALAVATASDVDRRALVATDAGLFALDENATEATRLDEVPCRAVARTTLGDVYTGDAEGVLRGPRGFVSRAHTGAITALLADGEGLVSGGEDGALLHVDCPANAPPRIAFRRAAHDDFTRALARAADGTIVSGGYDGTVRLWRSARSPSPTE